MIRPATEADCAAIAEIYNDAVRHTTAVFNHLTVDVANRMAWRAERLAQGFPVLVEEEGGVVRGYASYGPFRNFPGYRATVEHSVYIHPEARGAGLGRALMVALIDHARAAGLHVLVGGIEAQNRASIRLHESLGFVQTGHMPEVGQKFGRWLDLCLMQLRLDDRPSPGAES